MVGIIGNLRWARSPEDKGAGQAFSALVDDNSGRSGLFEGSFIVRIESTG